MIALDLEQTLADLGFETTFFAQAEQLVAALAERCASAVLMNVGGQEDAALRTAQAARQNGTPLVFFTAANDRPIGFDDVPTIRKPYSSDDVARVLVSVMA